MKAETHAFVARELGANERRMSNQENLPKEIVQRKGVSYFFDAGDVIEFEEDPIIRIESFEGFEGRIVPTFGLRAYCKKWGEFFFSLALTRRTPLTTPLEGEEKSEFDLLMEDNPLGSKLIIKQTDYNRAYLLAGKKIRVTAKLRLHQATWDSDAGKYDYSNLQSITCYKWEMLDE